MTQTLTGGCLGAAVRYTCQGEVGAAGFSASKGLPRSSVKAGDSGRPVARFFCGDCGSPRYALPPLHLDVGFIKAGSLDDPNVVKPSRQAWMRSRVGWPRSIRRSLRTRRTGFDPRLCEDDAGGGAQS